MQNSIIDTQKVYTVCMKTIAAKDVTDSFFVEQIFIILKATILCKNVKWGNVLSNVPF